MEIKDLYDEILKCNTVTYSNGWKNAKMFKVADEFCQNYFGIELDDFKEVCDTINVQIYNVSLKYKKKIILCKRRV